MRKLLSARFLFPLTTVAAVGFWAACGGSTPQDVTAADAGVDATSTIPDTDTGTFEPIDATPPIVDSGPDTSAPPPFDAGPVVFLDAGPDFDGGIPCFGGGELEQEPNDDPSTANLLAPTRCGVISVPDAGGPDGGESDWLTFEAQDASTGFRLYYEGQVHVFVQVGLDGGAPIDISLPGQSLPFTHGEPYYIQLRSNDGNTQLWKVVLQEDIPTP